MSRVMGRIVEKGVTKPGVNIGERVTSVALTLVLNAQVQDEILIRSGNALATPVAKTSY